jgi:Response regulator of the LytR/AlgR family
MIKALILDDEVNCIDTIELILQKKFSKEIDVVAKCTSIEEAIDCMDLYNPEIVFLDVEMPNGSGFDFLQNVRNHNFNVIFVTAHENYALKAIKFNAIDYILKPVNPVELEEAVLKIINKISQQQSGSFSEIKNLLDNLKNLKTETKKIAIIGVKQTIFAEIKEIIRCYYQEPYTVIHLVGDRVHHSPKSLKEFDEMLCDYNFMRVNPSDLINLMHVKAYINGTGGFAVMTDGSKVEISRRRKVEFMAKTRII